MGDPKELKADEGVLRGEVSKLSFLASIDLGRVGM